MLCSLCHCNQCSPMKFCFEIVGTSNEIWSRMNMQIWAAIQALHSKPSLTRTPHDRILKTLAYVRPAVPLFDCARIRTSNYTSRPRLHAVSRCSAGNSSRQLMLSVMCNYLHNFQIFPSDLSIKVYHNKRLCTLLFSICYNQ